MAFLLAKGFVFVVLVLWEIDSCSGWGDNLHNLGTCANTYHPFSDGC